MGLLICWANDDLVGKAMAMTKTGNKCAIKYYSLFRSKCEQIGGVGQIVQIDESNLARKPKHNVGSAQAPGK